jgi:outer membrane cobalamin receptor
MRIFFATLLLTLFSLLGSQNLSWAGVDGTIAGTVVDNEQIAVSGAKVQLLALDGRVLKETTTDLSGGFSFFPVNFGDYQISIQSLGYQTFTTQTMVTSSSVSKIDAQLIKGQSPSDKGEMIMQVSAKRKLVQPSSSGSKNDISHERIETLPGGTNASLTKVIAETTPGVVSGPFGQTFIRGNHANIQYQIDGVQLPDSMSGTFGDAFSTRNIDHMEVITGGIPAEYGERMAAVVNIITKTGPEKPGGSVELNYGSYNTFNPQFNFGGSDASGKLHYFAAASTLQTDRGIDTPQPFSISDQKQGGEGVSHDAAFGDDEFIHLDYLYDNTNKFSLNLFNEKRVFQMPTYPAGFNPNDPSGYFTSTYVDEFGNSAVVNGSPLFSWTPPNTSDSQTEQNSYIEAVWKKTLSERAFLQVTPYYKRSAIKFDNDPADDLASASLGIGATPTSFAMDRHVDNFGLKTDLSWRFNDKNLFKTGFQVQQSNTDGYFSTQTSTTPASIFDTNDTGAIEAIFAQDSYTISKPLTLNVGLRYTAIQFYSPDSLWQVDQLLQPRIGLEYMIDEITKVHVFYGKLFMPAPFENLRAAFLAGNPSASPYDLKGEKDDYYEAGVMRQFGNNQVASLTYYYKSATNMLDETQIPNTAIDQPYNFATGYATGLEFSVSGEITPHLSDFFNYSYEDAQGNGVSGGFFAFATLPPPGYYYLDHCQLDTANLGLTYKTDKYWITGQALYGSGLRTGTNNSASLPEHYSFDATIGYIFDGDTWKEKWKTSIDVTNITDNAYPIFIANGYNGSHYAAGRQFFLRVTKEL